MQINPHLVFDGCCEEAFRYYAKTLGGKIAFMITWGDSPAAKQAPRGFGKKVLHATLRVGSNVLMGCDVPPRQFEKMQGVSISIGVDKPAKAKKIFAALSKGGEVSMPLAKTFWAEAFGEGKH
jgi:PhnB protein